MTPELKQRIEQLRRGETPDGYKRTKAGIMPDDWNPATAKSLFCSVSEKGAGGKLEVLSATQDKGVIPRSLLDIDIKYDKENLSSYKRVAKGDFVISLRSFQGGIEHSLYDGLISPAYTVIKPIHPASDAYYKAYFKTDDFIGRLNRGTYGIRDGKQVSFADFGDLYLHFPSLAEQRKIADILSAQDKIIELKERLLTEKQRQKKYLMQRLLTGKQRLPGFSEKWKAIALKEYGFCIRGVSYHPKEDLRERKTPDSCLLYRANNITDGALQETDVLFVDKNKVSSAQIIRQGDILIAMSSGSKKAVGKSAYARNVHTDSCVGAFCAVFRSPYNDYCRHLFSSAIYDKNLSILLEGSNILNLNGGDIENMRFKVPSDISEQRAIAEILSTADREIDLLRRGLEQEKRVKKALSQLLLTGIVRV